VKEDSVKVCSSILHSQIAVKEGVKKLAKNDDSIESLYHIWSLIYADITLFDEEGVSYHTDIDLNNIDYYVRLVAEQFIQLLEVELPVNFSSLIWCDSCDYIGESKLARRADEPRPILSDFYDIDVCSNCKSKEFLRLISSFEARQYFLETRINR